MGQFHPIRKGAFRDQLRLDKQNVEHEVPQSLLKLSSAPKQREPRYSTQKGLKGWTAHCNFSSSTEMMLLRAAGVGV
jgi:hypothetical protein